MIGIRTKFTLATLFLSIVVVSVVGVSSRYIMLTRFEQLITERAMLGFMVEISDYYRSYGSWERAEGGESFAAFRDHRDDYRLRTPLDSEPQQPSQGRVPPPARQPRFAVVDENGTVQVAMAGLERGDRVEHWRVNRGVPITIDGEEVGLAVAVAVPELSDFDREYLRAIKAGWLYAVLAGITFSLPVGYLLSRHITRPIRDLRRAISDIEGGRLGLTVPVHSRDEIGKLSEAFNQMSAELAASHEKLQALTLNDELTGLPNRRAFEQEMEKLVAQSRRMGFSLVVGIADVDHFKQVNDTLSHVVGDRVLRTLAQLLQSHIRHVDMVARYGGEEFIFIFPQTSLEDAHMLCDKLRTVVEEYDWSTVDADLQKMTISFGLARHGMDGEVSDTIALADEKLYEAKDGGRNLVRS